jgi:hypothetical protein
MIKLAVDIIIFIIVKYKLLKRYTQYIETICKITRIKINKAKATLTGHTSASGHTQVGRPE